MAGSKKGGDQKNGPKIHRPEPDVGVKVEVTYYPGRNHIEVNWPHDKPLVALGLLDFGRHVVLTKMTGGQAERRVVGVQGMFGKA